MAKEKEKTEEEKAEKFRSNGKESHIAEDGNSVVDGGGVTMCQCGRGAGFARNMFD